MYNIIVLISIFILLLEVIMTNAHDICAKDALNDKKRALWKIEPITIVRRLSKMRLLIISRKIMNKNKIVKWNRVNTARFAHVFALVIGVMHLTLLISWWLFTIFLEGPSKKSLISLSFLTKKMIRFKLFSILTNLTKLINKTQSALRHQWRENGAGQKRYNYKINWMKRTNRKKKGNKEPLESLDKRKWSLHR